MKKCLILVNAYIKSETNLYQARRLKEELEKMEIKVDLKRNDYFASFVKGDSLVGANDYDFCIYLDKDKYIPLMLEKQGLKLFNSYYSLEACDDKMITFITLANNGIPMPTTLAGLMCYDKAEPLKQESLDIVEKTLGYPLVVKESFGSLGKGIHLANNRQELQEIAEQLKCTPHLFQEFIEDSRGKDIRVIVIGGKVVASMMRSSTTDFRSNVELGGTATKFDIDQDLTPLCERVAKILKLDYCGIDILLGKNGYLVCEVNSNAYFGGIERVTGINVAKAFAEHIYKTIYK